MIKIAQIYARVLFLLNIRQLDRKQIPQILLTDVNLMQKTQRSISLIMNSRGICTVLSVMLCLTSIKFTCCCYYIVSSRTKLFYKSIKIKQTLAYPVVKQTWFSKGGLTSLRSSSSKVMSFEYIKPVYL